MPQLWTYLSKRYKSDVRIDRAIGLYTRTLELGKEPLYLKNDFWLVPLEEGAVVIHTCAPRTIDEFKEMMSVPKQVGFADYQTVGILHFKSTGKVTCYRCNYSFPKDIEVICRLVGQLDHILELK